MAMIQVVRPVVDDKNKLRWITFDIDESELLPGETPLVPYSQPDPHNPPEEEPAEEKPVEETPEEA